jgi:hypothetical protein
MFKVPSNNVTVISVVSIPEQTHAGEATKDNDDKLVTKMDEIVDSLSY